jgi:hypothetical protein
MSFKDFYLEECKKTQVLTEDEIQDILRFIDVKRLKRSQRVIKTRPPKLGEKFGLDVVKKMFCSCEDFYYRAYYNLLKEKQSSFKFLPKEFQILLRQRYGGKKPPQPSREDEGVRMCKHLIAVTKKYVK